jgi:tetratricopeptide (TPR) repeat protein
MRAGPQDYSAAIKHYTEALEEDEEDITALCNRSAAYYCMELFKTSLKDADAVLAIDNTCAKAWERRGLALHGMGRKSEAQKAFTDGLMLGWEIDGYLNMLRQLGLTPPSKHLGPAAAAPAPPPKSAQQQQAELAKQRAPAAPRQAAAAVAPSPAAAKAPSSARSPPPAAPAHGAHSVSADDDEASSAPSGRDPAPSAPVPMGKQAKRAIQAAAGTPSVIESREATISRNPCI